LQAKQTSVNPEISWVSSEVAKMCSGDTHRTTCRVFCVVQAMSYEQSGKPHYHVRLRLLQPEGGSVSLPTLLRLRDSGAHVSAAAAGLAAIAVGCAAAAVVESPKKQEAGSSDGHSNRQRESEEEEEDERAEDEGRLSSIASDDVAAAAEHADPR
jgi:hypothetical protein